jgi:hypothetical protein
MTIRARVYGGQDMDMDMHLTSLPSHWSTTPIEQDQSIKSHNVLQHLSTEEKVILLSVRRPSFWLRFEKLPSTLSKPWVTLCINQWLLLCMHYIIPLYVIVQPPIDRQSKMISVNYQHKSKSNRVVMFDVICRNHAAPLANV